MTFRKSAHVLLVGGGAFAMHFTSEFFFYGVSNLVEHHIGSECPALGDPPRRALQGAAFPIQETLMKSDVLSITLVPIETTKSTTNRMANVFRSSSPPFLFIAKRTHRNRKGFATYIIRSANPIVSVTIKIV